MKLIPLTQGKFAKVDDADFDWLNEYKWHAHFGGKGWYVRRGIWKPETKTTGCIYMHVAIAKRLGLPQVDHFDRDGFNNQRANLRPCTQSQNNANQRRRKDNTSGFRGVGWHKQARKWRAYLGISGVQFSLGLHNSPEAAARAYDAAAKIAFGEFANLNFS